MKKQKVQNVFSAKRITRLVFSSWMIALFITFIIICIFHASIPRFHSLPYIVIALIFYLISTLIGALIFYLLTRKTNEITTEINLALIKIASGDFSARLNLPPANNEIDEVVKNFNKMAEELDSLSVVNSEFAANFSHEFKTPIASIKGYAELLNESSALGEQEKCYVEIILEEINRLSSLSSNTLTLCNLDSNTIEAHKQKYSLDEQLARCVLLFDNSFSEKNITLSSDIDKVKVVADKDLVKEVWINVLSNAIKFTPDGGKISVSLKEYGNFAFVTISDSGKGIPQSERKTVFTRHFRTKDLDGKSGSGLGLNIANRIIQLHGGAITVETSSLGGASFVIKIPL